MISIVRTKIYVGPLVFRLPVVFEINVFELIMVDAPMFTVGRTHILIFVGLLINLLGTFYLKRNRVKVYTFWCILC